MRDPVECRAFDKEVERSDTAGGKLAMKWGGRGELEGEWGVAVGEGVSGGRKWSGKEGETE